MLFDFWTNRVELKLGFLSLGDDTIVEKMGTMIGKSKPTIEKACDQCQRQARLSYISYILETEKSRYNLKNAVYKGQGIIWTPKKKLTYSVFKLDENSVR